MLLRLIRDYAGRYPGWILGTVVLQLAATMTILLLPALNARIIDVADTAGVVEQELALGEAAGYVTVQPIGAVTLNPERDAVIEGLTLHHDTQQLAA